MRIPRMFALALVAGMISLTYIAGNVFAHNQGAVAETAVEQAPAGIQLETTNPQCTWSNTYRVGILELDNATLTELQTDFYDAYDGSSHRSSSSGTGVSSSEKVDILYEARVCSYDSMAFDQALEQWPKGEGSIEGPHKSRKIWVVGGRTFTVPSDMPGITITGQEGTPSEGGGDPTYYGKFYFADRLKTNGNYRRGVWEVSKITVSQWYSNPALDHADQEPVPGTTYTLGYSNPFAGYRGYTMACESSGLCNSSNDPIVAYKPTGMLVSNRTRSNGEFYRMEYQGKEPENWYLGTLSPPVNIAPGSSYTKPEDAPAGTYQATHVRVDSRDCTGGPDWRGVNYVIRTPTGIANSDFEFDFQTTDDKRTISDLLKEANKGTGNYEISDNSRFFYGGTVYNCNWRNNTYWNIRIKEEGGATGNAAAQVEYELRHMKILDGCRCNTAAIIDAKKEEKITTIHRKVELDGAVHTWEEIRTALGISNGSRTIDDTGDVEINGRTAKVYNFRNGRNTYLLVTKKEIPPPVEAEIQ